MHLKLNTIQVYSCRMCSLYILIQIILHYYVINGVCFFLPKLVPNRKKVLNLTINLVRCYIHF